MPLTPDEAAREFRNHEADLWQSNRLLAIFPRPQGLQLIMEHEDAEVVIYLRATEADLCDLRDRLDDHLDGDACPSCGTDRRGLGACPKCQRPRALVEVPDTVFTKWEEEARA